ncbi:magnesium chelatase subunit D [Lichenifustis flavocetrariae]|uniref:Magnesium chelatase subunit D n=1 Tax=Lichenifustis flavocetrariae TaxID=2949735 RepID=A0AA41YTZ3_9HYPH|nr:magnesium chelatase subunit D [Lichenifustis flavocetrariae]MCW6507275.1 magnesium chelatase subunit D [Lichenifustis flavocetrariae]
MTRPAVDPTEWTDPMWAALLCAVDPFGFGGVVLRARAGLARDRWLAQMRELLPPETPWRRLPMSTAESRLFGGLDLAATLAAGRPVAERGLLADADGGILLIPMAERLTVPLAARLGSVLDSGQVIVARDGLNGTSGARVAMIALDEGIDEEHLAAVLRDRMAFLVELDQVVPDPVVADGRETVKHARDLYADVVADDAILTVLSGTAVALGVDSLRATIMAVRAARAAAALAGRETVTTEDAAIAARLVLAPRATRLPAASDAPEAPSQEPGRQTPSEPDSGPSQHPGANEALEQHGTQEAPNDMVLAAAKAAIPPGLLLRLQSLMVMRTSKDAAGRAGAMQETAKRGRPSGVRRGVPGGTARLNVIETLRAAAPWQKLRGRGDSAAVPPPRVMIRRDDLRITRYKQRTETTTIFAVDASGSLAVNRLAEAKGAVELLLAECYTRRDQVALLAFRGRGTELVLPPTRSLTRAKRGLAELPGGGATPLAGAIDAAVTLAEQLRRRGQTPLVVFLTDGRANVARDGTTGRARAEDDAGAAAKAAGATGIRMLVVDASPRPQAQARALATAMNAMYLPLPRAEAATLSQAVRAAGGA